MLMRNERGMTVIELVVAMAIGTIVIAGALTALTRAFQIQKEAVDRTDATQRGRLALESMTRVLRSQVCMGTPRTAVKAADNNSVSVTADLSGGATLPDKYTLTYSPTAKTMTEYMYDGSGTYPTLIFPSTPTRTRVLLTNVVASGSTPIFTYWALQSTGDGANTQLTSVPLSDANMSKVASISINYTTRPAGTATDDKRATAFKDDVYVRSSDPVNPDGGQTCL
jgi:prepilin-type N-terminal cleavage/methylation domain-containing protein